MTRWRKGTTDHDSDGKMGGSLKEKTMTEKKTPAKKAAKPAAPVVAGQDGAADADTAVAAVKAKKAAVEAQFAEADAKAEPDEQALADLQVQRSVRGW